MTRMRRILKVDEKQKGETQHCDKFEFDDNKKLYFAQNYMYIQSSYKTGSHCKKF